MKSLHKLFVLIALVSLIAGCGGSDPVGPSPEAPSIVDLKIEPEVICVGSSAEITFEVVDPNQDPVTWNIKLSTNIHGTPVLNNGTNASGSFIDIKFKAATSGRHRHRVVLTVSAQDQGGLQAPEQNKDLFVFNCS
jgi:hypothetical protein